MAHNIQYNKIENFLVHFVIVLNEMPLSSSHIHKNKVNLLSYFVDNISFLYYPDCMNKIILICFLVLVLAACGRMSRPVAPDGSVHPQTYIIKE